MTKKGKIAQYRERLDSTLASHDLVDEKKLETLVKDQLLRSSGDESKGYIDNVLAKRTEEVSNFLEMLRSASENYGADKAQHASWKLKQDHEEFRVMYREGPVGSPFHSLLVEGYINAPLDVCLCVSWETALYPRWFPETLIPTFKVVMAESLQKVRTGEQISVVRMKLSWPLSNREAIFHYFEFEYLEDDLIIVLINTIPDVDNIHLETHGFTNDGIPEAGSTVRIDLVGGFALQKVTENRSYFRTIGNMDIKLDFVPPSFINFISRQLIGSGFRFYQKIVASVSKGDEAFAKVLKDPLYSRIREAALPNDKSKRNRDEQIIQDHTTTNFEDPKTNMQGSINKDSKVLGNDHMKGYLQNCKPTSNEIEEEEVEESINVEHKETLGNMFKDEKQKVLYNGLANGYSHHSKPANEIEEEEIERSEKVVENGKVRNTNDRKEDSNSTGQLQLENHHKKVQISPQVEQALGTLDRVITVVREGRLKAQGLPHRSPEIERGETECVGKQVKWSGKEANSTGEFGTAYVSTNGISIDGLRSKDSNSNAQKSNPVMTSTGQNPSRANWLKNSPRSESSPVVDSPMTVEVNNINLNNNKKTGQPKRWRLCCLYLISEKFVS